MTPTLAVLIALAIGIPALYLVWRRRARKEADSSTQYLRETSGSVENRSEIWYVPNHLTDGSDSRGAIESKRFSIVANGNGFYGFHRPSDIHWTKFDRPDGTSTIHYLGNSVMKVTAEGLEII